MVDSWSLLYLFKMNLFECVFFKQTTLMPVLTGEVKYTVLRTQANETINGLLIICSKVFWMQD